MTKKKFTKEERIKYYGDRLTNSKLSRKQQIYARERLIDLTGFNMKKHKEENKGFYSNIEKRNKAWSQGDYKKSNLFQKLALNERENSKLKRKLGI